VIIDYCQLFIGKAAPAAGKIYRNFQGQDIVMRKRCAERMGEDNFN
jgi:hypothetical protein